jgi:hypothetical protein
MAIPAGKTRSYRLLLHGRPTTDLQPYKKSPMGKFPGKIDQTFFDTSPFMIYFTSRKMTSAIITKSMIAPA